MISRVAVVITGVFMVARLTGCTITGGNDLTPVRAPTPAKQTASASPTPFATGIPSPTGEAGKPFDDQVKNFDRASTGLIEAQPDARGKELAEALVSAGFDKDSISFTAAQTTVGKNSDAVFWAVRIDKRCIVGEYRPYESDPSVAKYLRQVVDSGASGDCLVSKGLKLE